MTQEADIKSMARVVREYGIATAIAMLEDAEGKAAERDSRAYYEAADLLNDVVNQVDL